MKKKHLEPTNKKISLRRQCILLGLSWSTFMFKSIKGDKWQENEILNQQLKRQMDEFQLKFPWFGVESYHIWLEKHFKMTLNVKRIRRLMREMGLVSLAPGPHTSTPHPGHKTYPYLLRNLSITYPNQVWCADITYLPMAKGHMYLVAVMDWYSRKVLSWRISNTMEEAFCIDALREAIAKYGKPLIFNTDQGSQFTGENWIRVLKHHEINISMDGKGRALDNVMIERLWRSYKYEYLYLNSPENGQKLKEGTENWINFYNKNRFHQTLDEKTPDQVYQEVHSKVAA
jgi:putative transposase